MIGFRLLRTNKMRQLRHCCTSLTFKSIESAKCFIDNLSSATEISKLSIIVGLQEDHYPSEEQMFFALAQVIIQLAHFLLGIILKYLRREHFTVGRTINVRLVSCLTGILGNSYFLCSETTIFKTVKLETLYSDTSPFGECSLT